MQGTTALHAVAVAVAACSALTHLNCCLGPNRARRCLLGLNPPRRCQRHAPGRNGRSETTATNNHSHSLCAGPARHPTPLTAGGLVVHLAKQSETAGNSRRRGRCHCSSVSTYPWLRRGGYTSTQQLQRLRCPRRSRRRMRCSTGARSCFAAVVQTRHRLTAGASLWSARPAGRSGHRRDRARMMWMIARCARLTGLRAVRAGSLRPL
jgi:hypothetical protein